MINKPLANITSEDIKNLVTNNVLERRTLEYKAQLPDNSDGDKKEFLADVSSFANTIGGDLIFGIKENNGTVETNFGLNISNSDAEIARLENIIRDGIAPRIKPEIEFISLEDNNSILIIRLRGSLESPHRVIFKSHDKFYARNSNGKYSMDVLELRNAFAQTSAITERIKDFRTNRILNVKSGEDSFTTIEKPFLALHFIPLSAFNTSVRLNADQLVAVKNSEIKPSLSPLYAGGWSHRINLLGVLAYSSPGNDKTITTYTQLYREGIIEAVDKEILSDRGEKKLLPMYALEKEIMQFVNNNLKLITSLEFQPPFYIFLTLANILSYSVAIPDKLWGTDAEAITVNDLLLPEVIIDTASDDIEQKFRPIFDMIWNAAGVSRSLNFDENDKFIKR